MPILEITTDQTPKDIKALTKALSAVFAEQIGKPESYCLVTFNKVDSFYYSGSDEPGFLARVDSIGHIDNDRNASLTAAITEVLEKEFGVELNHRGYFIFNDIPGANIGYKNSTFAKLVSGKK